MHSTQRSAADSATHSESNLWTVAVLLATLPVVISLCLTIWRTPFPVSEAVALFEDVSRNPPGRFLRPDTHYYRPLFQITLSTIWHNAGSLDARLAWIKLLDIVPVMLLVGLLVWHFRPRNVLDAAAAAIAVAVAVGSPGFRDNLEIPLAFTMVGMPIVIAAWMVVNAERRRWSALAIVLLTIVAVGFKEHGLALVPLVAAAWWGRAPGVSRGVVATLVALTVGYLALRWAWHEKWPLFEQSVGLGFTEIEPSVATSRFGSFPFWMYAYTAASTIANVLFSEPTRGIFSITRHVVDGRPQPWELIHIASSFLLTATIVWWGAGELRKAARGTWTPEARAVVSLALVLLACGVLSFNYSRDRHGGMVVPLYATAAFHAIRAAASRASEATRTRFVAGGLVLAFLGGAWQLRAVATVEHARITASRNSMEWLRELPKRRAEFADRDVYLGIMESMVEQGTRAGAARPTPYPSIVARTLGEQ